MATANVLNVLRMQGRLVADPTDLALPFPHGGTPLGLSRDVTLRFGVRTRELTAEEFGGQVVEAWYTGQTATLSAVLREFDRDALARCFPNVLDAGQGLHQTVTAGLRAGARLSTKAFKLLVAPTTALDRHPFAVLYLAAPAVEQVAELLVALRFEVGFPVRFYGLPDATGRVYAVETRDKLPL